jgi:uncharacterized protein (TIGR02145 family)
MMVDIYYNLTVPNSLYRITSEASFDGGTNFTAISQVSGDVGYGITTGNLKHIIWNFGSEFPLIYNITTKIRITAIPACGLLIDTRDGQSYNTVQIGTQCWMAENLNIGTWISDTVAMTDNDIIEKYSGGLYQWHEMMQYSNTPGVQGICPAGWHVPTDPEWCTLSQFIDPTVDCSISGWAGTDGGTKMKSTSGWISGNGSNASGFNALPLGGVHFNGGFFDQGYKALFWSSTDFYIYGAWCRMLWDDETTVIRDTKHRGYGFNVRCVKN